MIAAELNARPDEEFLLGSSFQACDVLLGHVLLWAASLNWLPVPAQPEDTATVLAYVRRLVERPAFKACVEMGCWSPKGLQAMADM